MSSVCNIFYNEMCVGQLIVASCTTKLSAHIENKFLLKKLQGTIEWLQRKRPSVVVYCPIWNRIAQISSLVLGIPHGKADLHCVNPTYVYTAISCIAISFLHIVDIS